MPRFSEDDVTDFLVTEALVTRATLEKQSAQKDRERQDWMKNHKDWAKEQGLVDSAGGGR
jgi:hypothetical protein